MDTETRRDKIIEQLELLNKRVQEQNSMGRAFGRGIVYGIGFFIGSAIIATIALGILGPILGKISWVSSSFEAGKEIINSGK